MNNKKTPVFQKKIPLKKEEIMADIRNELTVIIGNVELLMVKRMPYLDKIQALEYIQIAAWKIANKIEEDFYG